MGNISPPFLYYCICAWEVGHLLRGCDLRSSAGCELRSSLGNLSPWVEVGKKTHIKTSGGFCQLLILIGRLQCLWLCLNYERYSWQLVLVDRVELCRVSSLMLNEVPHIDDYWKSDLICLKMFYKTFPRAFYINFLGIKIPWYGFWTQTCFWIPAWT